MAVEPIVVAYFVTFIDHRKQASLIIEPLVPIDLIAVLEHYLCCCFMKLGMRASLIVALLFLPLIVPDP